MSKPLGQSKLADVEPFKGITVTIEEGDGWRIFREEHEITGKMSRYVSWTANGFYGFTINARHAAMQIREAMATDVQ